MSLSALDARRGSIVDHTWERVRDEDGRPIKEVMRPTIRRGIIVRVDGEGTDSIGGSENPGCVYVMFKPGAEPESVDMAELVRVYPAAHKVAREAYRRIIGAPKYVGAEFQARKAPARARLKDEMAVTPRQNFSGVVQPEVGTEEKIAGMDLEDTGA